jgi:hypothetical protein
VSQSEERRDDAPLLPGVAGYLDYAQWGLYGRYVNPETLHAEEPGADDGLRNAVTVARFIEGLEIDTHDPAYRQFTQRIARLVVEGYTYGNSLTTNIAIAAYCDMLICRGVKGWKQQDVSVVYETGPHYRGNARTIYLQDGGRPAGETLMCEQFIGTEIPDDVDAPTTCVVVSRLAHMVGQARYVAVFREPQWTSEQLALDPSLDTGARLIQEYDWSRLLIRDVRITMSVGEEIGEDDDQLAV